MLHKSLQKSLGKGFGVMPIPSHGMNPTTPFVMHAGLHPATGNPNTPEGACEIPRPVLGLVGLSLGLPLYRKERKAWRHLAYLKKETLVLLLRTFTQALFISTFPLCGFGGAPRRICHPRRQLFLCVKENAYILLFPRRWFDPRFSLYFLLFEHVSITFPSLLLIITEKSEPISLSCCD